MKRRTRVGFDAQALQVIEALKQGSVGRPTTADVVKDALAFYEWTRRQLDKGYTLGVLRDGEPPQEVILPFLRKKT